MTNESNTNLYVAYPKNPKDDNLYLLSESDSLNIALGPESKDFRELIQRSGFIDCEDRFAMVQSFRPPFPEYVDGQFKGNLSQSDTIRKIQNLSLPGLLHSSFSLYQQVKRGTLCEIDRIYSLAMISSRI